MITIYSADICPFAHRTTAMLTHMGIRFETRVINLSDRDPEFLKLTPTGKVPLLVDGDVKLYESRIINDYVAEKYEFPDAYDPDVYHRSRQRLAMLQWDEVILGEFYRSLRSPDGIEPETRKKLARELDEIVRTVRLVSGSIYDLMGFHFAPFWARMDWLRGLTPFPKLVDSRPELVEWLNRAVAIPAVQATLPPQDTVVRSYEERFAKAP